MGAAVGREADAVAFFAALAEAPFRHDFYQTLRRIDCLHDAPSRWGQARRPAEEPVRLGQEPHLEFAPAPLASLEMDEGRPPRLLVRLFGLLGPNGPLPAHLTEYVRMRLRQRPSDPTFARFLDLFHHRLIAVFYRAWAQAQPHVQRDRPASDRFAAYVGAFLGLEPSSMRDRDRVPDEAKLFHAWTLARRVRNADGLEAILRQFFRVPVRLQEFVGHWLRLAPGDRTRLDGRVALGAGAVVGARVWDRQSKFRLHLGPLTLAEYERFLPATPAEAGDSLAQVADWVRCYLGRELDWDVCLHLHSGEVPAVRLGRSGRLGWMAWIGRRATRADAGDLCLDVEALLERGAAA